LTPTRKNGYSSVVAQVKGRDEEKSEEVIPTAMGGKGRFGFRRLVDRVRSRSFGEVPYAPPSPELLRLVKPPPESSRPTSPHSADLWKKLFSAINAEQRQETLNQNKGGAVSKQVVERRVKVTVEDGVRKKALPLKPPPQPPKQTPYQASRQLQQRQQLQRRLSSSSSPSSQHQPSHPELNQLQLLQRPSSAGTYEARRVHYRDEISDFSGQDFTASFIYDNDDDDDEFNDETSRSVATGTSSAASMVSDKTGTTGDSLFTDLSGYTSTITEPTIGSESMLADTTPPRRGDGKSSYRFGPLRCDGRDDDDSDDNNSRPPQGLAEGLLEDVKSVLTELARGILCLPDPRPNRP
jgi:hypothetical protein